MNKEYWENRYTTQQTGWDVGYAVPAITAYFNSITNKTLRILIPGAGNGYEAAYLWQQGFTNIYVVDIAQQPLLNLKQRIPAIPDTQLIQSDFFELSGTYDIIIEHTFFCALTPGLRPKYAEKMNSLLTNNGYLVGLLFTIPLTQNGPPYGGTPEDYKALFANNFVIEKMEPAYNSIKPRQGREVFIKMRPLK